MKIEGTKGYVHELWISISGVLYKGKQWDFEFWADLNGEVHVAMCEEVGAYHIGSGFFEKAFGIKQTKEIKRICRKAILKFINDYIDVTDNNPILLAPRR